MKKGDKKGQFYLIATIIIVGLMIGLAVIFNYSIKTNSNEAKEIAKELSIESKKVMDYDIVHSTDEFENFARGYSAYIGDNKEIYFIVVNGSYKRAYKYTNEASVDFTSSLIVDEDIKFGLDGEIYNFKLNQGKNFYFIVVYETGGNKYVFTG